MAKEKLFVVAVCPRRQLGRATAVLGVAVALLAGCASYTAKPLVPSNTAAALERRTLDEPGLAEFIQAASPDYAAAAGLPDWDLSTLTLAALYFHPEIEVSRAKLALARAGVKTAGQIPNPTLSISPGQYPALIDASGWTVGFLVSFVLEIAGKREKRVEQARNLVEAARQDIATAAWQVRGGVRSAMLDLWAAERRLRLVERRQTVQAQVVTLLEGRFVAGEMSALDVARERINLSQARLSLRDTERQAAEARARLAATLGVPVRAIEGVKLSLGSFDRPAETPDVNDLAAGSLRRKALQERTDVLGLLAEYEATQSGVRLETAKQFPNINLGPGYTYDQGFDLYTFDLSIELPIFNQNQGPIAEAEARRKEAAARLVALQAKIIGDIDKAIASYRGGTRAVATADTLLQGQVRRRQQIDRAFKLGEVDRLAVLTTDLEQAIIDLAHFEAVVQLREALALIEDALQHSMFDGGSQYIRLPEKKLIKGHSNASQ